MAIANCSVHGLNLCVIGPIEREMNDDAITALLDNLREAFLEEMPSRIDAIEQEVMGLPESENHDELFRIVHSLKGSAGTHNLHVLGKIAHDMEDVLLSLLQQQQLHHHASLRLLLDYIDIFRDATAALLQTDTAPLDVDERLQALRQQVFAEKPNILVVEPSKMYASMVEYSLQSLAVNLTYVDDGLPALEHLLLNKYDVLISSMECPRLNGDALIAALRLTHNFNRDIKAVLITSRDMGSMAEETGFDVILDRKAVKEGRLHEVIQNWFNK